MLKLTIFLLFLFAVIQINCLNSFGSGKMALANGAHDSEYYDEYYDDDEHHTTHRPTTRRRRTTAHPTTHPTRRRRTTAHMLVTTKLPPGTKPPQHNSGSVIDGGLMVAILGTLRSPNGTAYAFNQTFILSPK